MKKRIIIIAVVIVFIIGGASGVYYVAARFPVRYMEIIMEHAGEIEPSLILAVIMAESSFRPRAESHRGARGLMQLMPATAEDLAERLEIENFDPEMLWLPEINIKLGVFYLNLLHNTFGGNTTLMLAAYNAGQGNVRLWLADPQSSSDGSTLDNIPFPETSNYVQRVQRYRLVYRLQLLFTRK